VILGSFSSEAFANGLRALLTETGEFDVIAVEDPSDLQRTAELDRSSILIAEGVDPAECSAFLETATSGSVLLFDPVGARAFVGLSNPDWRQLVDVIRAIVSVRSGSDSVEAKDRVRIIDPLRLVLDELGDWVATTTGELDPLIEWLNLGLGLALLRRTGPTDRGIPGWSVSAQDALGQIGFDSTPSAAEVRARWDEIDQGLVVTRRTLPTGLRRLVSVVGLAERELRLLCWSLAPEIDGRFATAIGVLHDDLTRRQPSATLFAELPGFEAASTWELRRHLSAARSIVAEGLLRPVDAVRPATEIGYEPTPVVVAHLLARSRDDFLAAIGATHARPEAATRPLLGGDGAEQSRQLQRALAAGPTVVHLLGGDRHRSWARHVVAAAGLPLLVGDLQLVGAADSRSDPIADWALASRLTGAGLLILGLDALGDEERRRALSRLATVDLVHVLLATGNAGSIDESRLQPNLVLTPPTASARRRAEWWRTAADEIGIPLSTSDVERLSATVRIEPPAIESALLLASNRQGARLSDEPVTVVQQAARDLFPATVPPGGRRIVPVYRWDDIVLPEQALQLLRSIPTHLIKSGTVMERWGFANRLPYGQGIAALFSGPSGTGKTMAAQIIAGEIGVEVLQVDLSKTVSKYIGETEKNLDRLFDAAEQSGAVLVFDEADALFGKRTEVKDAHDRHANVEVAYLLQRMEAFRGLAILTTNLKQNIDNAFFRRLRFVVDFTLPTASERRAIWQRVFPPGAPLAPDLDLSFLARRMPIPGGSIQNIALHAAYLAAGEGTAIGSDHVMAATRRELLKIGMLSAERSLDEPAA
jgi:hypothetical protein